MNVLVYASREDAVDHARYRRWFDDMVGDDEPFAYSDTVLSGVLRIITYPRIFDPPTPLADALAFVETTRAQPNAVPVAPGPRHWNIFTELCRSSGVKGNLVPDAYLAALAIEAGCEWITTDRNFARFPGLRWRHPLDA